MSVLCAWASKDEQNKIKGGLAGDQTGSEVKTGSIYDFGQTLVVRCKDSAVAKKIGCNAKMIALNDLVGYDQSERTTIYQMLASGGWKLSAITAPCELDCSELAVCAVNIAYGRGLLASGTYSGNLADALAATKLFDILTDPKYLGKSEYIMSGDILVKPGSHVIIACSDGSKTGAQSSTVSNSAAATSHSLEGSVIAQGQQYAIQFTGVSIAVDGKIGSETNQMKVRILQHAMNADYGNTIKEDGVFGPLSNAKLGSHYITLGETQYLVTAAEILFMLHGIAAGGVEFPGIFGTGLANAAKIFNGSINRLDASDFKELIQ